MNKYISFTRFIQHIKHQKIYYNESIKIYRKSISKYTNIKYYLGGSSMVIWKFIDKKKLVHNELLLLQYTIALENIFSTVDKKTFFLVLFFFSTQEIRF